MAYEGRKEDQSFISSVFLCRVYEWVETDGCINLGGK